jgi:hypothetical protein
MRKPTPGAWFFHKFLVLPQITYGFGLRAGDLQG